MKLASETSADELTTQSETKLCIVITGPGEDVVLKERLEKRGHEITFVESEKDLPDAASNFNFSYMKPGIEHAQKNGFDIVMGIDKSYGKISLAVRKEVNGGFVLLNVHQLAAILIHHWLENNKDIKLVALKSVHISEMIDTITAKTSGKCVSEIIAPGMLEASARSLSENLEVDRIVGFTENQEFYDSTQDFDEILEDIILLEQQSRENGRTLFDSLVELYKKYGFYKEKTYMVDIVSKRQKSHLLTTMGDIRKDPGVLEDRFTINRVTDYLRSVTVNLLTQKKMALGAPKTNMLRLESGGNTAITFAPTADKMYYYLSIKGRLTSKEAYLDENRSMDGRMVKLMEILNKL